MVTVETIGRVRRLLSQKVSIRAISRQCCISRNTVRKIRDSGMIIPQYKKREPRPGKLTPYEKSLCSKLEEDIHHKDRQRRKAVILYEELQREGYTGSYDTVRRYVSKWKQEHKNRQAAYIPLEFKPGEAFQFDWSTETVELAGEVKTVQVAHVRLCYSRMSFVIAFHRQAMEMLLEAHVCAHDFFGGLCTRGIYDNLKTVVSKIGRGKERTYNSRFMALASHYLFEPTACTPASGNEKGQVEQQVDTLRDHLFTPRLRFSNLAELNAHLSEQCRYRARLSKHPEFSDKTIWEVYEEEKPLLVHQSNRFEAYSSVTKKASSTCLVYHDHNRYSLPCEYAGKVIEVRAYASKIALAWNGKEVARHERSYDRDRYLLRFEHYIPLLERKPGAVRNGRPFNEENLPEPIIRLLEELNRYDDGEKQFSHILLAIPTYGQDAVITAIELMLEAGTANESTILNAVSRLTEEKASEDIAVADDLTLRYEPKADCSQYDDLLEVRHAS